MKPILQSLGESVVKISCNPSKECPAKKGEECFFLSGDDTDVGPVKKFFIAKYLKDLNAAGYNSGGVPTSCTKCLGKAPFETQNLFWVHYVRQHSHQYKGNDVLVTFGSSYATTKEKQEVLWARIPEDKLAYFKLPSEHCPQKDPRSRKKCNSCI